MFEETEAKIMAIYTRPQLSQRGRLCFWLSLCLGALRPCPLGAHTKLWQIYLRISIFKEKVAILTHVIRSKMAYLYL